MREAELALTKRSEAATKSPRKILKSSPPAHHPSQIITLDCFFHFRLVGIFTDITENWLFWQRIEALSDSTLPSDSFSHGRDYFSTGWRAGPICGACTGLAMPKKITTP